MTIHFQRERAITLAEVPQYVPKRHGKKVHYSTVYRWMTKGVRGKTLESFMVGGVRFTTVEAVHRFFELKSDRQRHSEDSLLNQAIDEALTRDGV
jgi:Protein of unknown function (DUF1580)